MSRIRKIVITGGPGAGKSTAIKCLPERLERSGYRVLVIAETATELMNGGVSAESVGSVDGYQDCQFYLQRCKEAAYAMAAERMDDENILIICDRGLIDNKAYMGEESFAAMLSRYGVTERELVESYDAVFHLVTAARGAEEHYTLSNNSARTEDPETARRVDDDTLSAWSVHPNLFLIESRDSMEEKIDDLVDGIEEFLRGEAAEECV